MYSIRGVHDKGDCLLKGIKVIQRLNNDLYFKIRGIKHYRIRDYEYLFSAILHHSISLMTRLIPNFSFEMDHQ